jgi:hypothetical protein
MPAAMKALPALLLLLCLPQAGADEAWDIAARSLPYIKEKGLAWIEDRQCASCHQVPGMLWSLNRAARVGLDADRSQSSAWTPWAVDWRHWNQSGDKDGVDKVSAANIDTMSFLLLGSEEGAASWKDDFRRLLLKNQQADGSWKSGGQLPLGKRPAREIHEVTTQWALLALKQTGDDPPPDEVVRRAESFLASAAPGKSTEWHALRLLLQPEHAAHRETLLKFQHEDGSWGWLVDTPGDAFGTGLALFALARTGIKADDPARKRAVEFLRRTKQTDGSWAVPSTRARDDNKINKTATYWGTCWAVIGLLEVPPKLEKDPSSTR